MHLKRYVMHPAVRGLSIVLQYSQNACFTLVISSSHFKIHEPTYAKLMIWQCPFLFPFKNGFCYLATLYAKQIYHFWSQ